jgi:hypothetical protein
MASTTTDGGVSACAASGTWLCGLLSGFADAELLFTRYPWVGFVVVAMIGGFVGWCILLERGEFDDEPRLTVARRFMIRVAIGAAVGGAASILWYAYGGESKGMPMLIAALVAVFPLEAYRGGLRRFRAILREAFK